MVSGAPDYWLKGKYIELIETINRVKLIDEITKIAGITNISNIASLDLLDRITLIDEITKIGEISKIKDVTHPKKSLIANSLFEQGFAGWVTYGVVSVETYMYGFYVHFTSLQAGDIRQHFPIAIAVSWFTQLYCYIRSPSTAVDVLRVDYYYTDGTSSYEYLQVTVANYWQQKVLSPTAGKVMEYIVFAHPVTYPECDLRRIIMVF